MIFFPPIGNIAQDAGKPDSVILSEAKDLLNGEFAHA
jgi:hypothetical protein